MLTVCYVIIALKAIRKPQVQQLGSAISAERKLLVTLFMVSAVSKLALLPFLTINIRYVKFSEKSFIQRLMLWSANEHTIQYSLTIRKRKAADQLGRT